MFLGATLTVTAAARTPIAPAPPWLSRENPTGEPDRFRPLTQCIRISASPGRSDDPAIARRWTFQNVCRTRISFWYCERRGCPRMTFHALIEPGESSLHAARKDANPSDDGGDSVACPYPAAEFARQENGWVCSKAP